MKENKCHAFAVSEDYISFLVRYNSDLVSVNDILSPECVTIINNQFLIAYRKTSTLENSSLLKYRNSLFPKCYALMDESAIAETGAARIQSFSELSLTGKDVLVGFVDTGIDYTSKLFQTSQGQTRIEAIWDQTTTSSSSYSNGFSSTNDLYSYGSIYNKTQINEALESDSPLPLLDVNSTAHGSFLASVCAGTKNASAGFSSMAPEAGIIAVKLKQAKQNLRDFYGISSDADCYSEDDIILGIHFLLEKARELGKPIAICLALGTNQGDHNSSTILEQYLSSLAYLRGVCIVSAAGNELGYGSHFRREIAFQNDFSPTRPTTYISTIEINVEQLQNAKTNFSMELWGASPDVPRLSIISPSGERFSQVPYLYSDNANFTFLFEQTKLYIEMTPTNIITGSPSYFLRFTDTTEGIWTIEVTHTKTIDAWLPVHSFLTAPVSFTESNPDDTITSPGNGNGTITAAGYNHTNGAIYQNSGRGYTRLQRIKPDFAAPAVNVFGAFIPSTKGNTLFTRFTGTSVAAALTTGAAALLLEWFFVRGNNTNINTTIIREYLIRGASMPQNRSVPNREFGFGILDLVRTFDQFRSTT